MADLIHEHLGLSRPGTSETVVVGDQPATDGRLAEALGVPYLQVLTGVTGEADLPSDVAIAAVADDLAAHVAGWTGSTGR